MALLTRGAGFNQLVQLLEVEEVDLFVALGLGAVFSNLETFQLSPAVLRCLFDCCLDLDHLLHGIGDLCALPATQLTTLKQNVNMLACL